MTKTEVSKKVLKNGKPLSLYLFNWDEETNTFSSTENHLTFNFKGIDNIIFKTGGYCTFETGGSCIFKTGGSCTFITRYSCIFITGSQCTFDTENNCTFDTGSQCTFDTEIKCVIIRRDIYEIIEIPANIKIKLNSYKVKGYEIVNDMKTIIIDGKTIEISNESYENLKKQLVK